MNKVFFGSVKEMTNERGTMYSLWIRKEDLEKLTFNEKGFANVSIKKSKKWNWYCEVYKPKDENWFEDRGTEDEIPF